jgi:gas vesicle protein
MNKMVLTNAKEIMTMVWENVKPLLQGITIGGIVSTVFYAVTSASTKKVINKVNYEEIVKSTQEKAIDRIGETTLNVNIAPVVDNRLNALLKDNKDAQQKEMAELRKEIGDVKKMVAWIGSMYDDSLVVDEKKKAEFKALINEPKKEVKPEPVIQVIDVKGLEKQEKPVVKETKVKEAKIVR